MPRDDVKADVTKGDLRLLLGTDAASEGLNLRKLGTLINFDLSRNPTRLEQRKGRIQRIGQITDFLEAPWVEVALSDIERAKKTIDAIPKRHPFELKYRQVEKTHWESCATEFLNPTHESNLF